jgi:hypothetical protein
MIQKELIKNYNKSSVLKEFYSLNNLFLSTISKVNHLLDANNINEALHYLEQIKYYASQIEILKESLPSKEFIEKENFLEKLEEQQIKIEKESNKTDLLLKVHLEIANNISDFVRQQLIKEKISDAGYNQIGSISIDEKSFRPVAYVGEI